jgi:uncharacterized membrane protein
MNSWDDLLSAALVGTERSTARLDAALQDAALGLAVRAFAADAEAEHRLLIAAAVAGSLRRAGFVPVIRDQAPPPRAAAVETLPPCSLRTMLTLRAVIEGKSSLKPLVAEALTILARKSKRVPHPFLPRLFEIASVYRKDARWVAAVARVMGERGKWLAEQNAHWSFLLSAQPELIDQDAERMNREQEAAALRILHEAKVIAHYETIQNLMEFGVHWSGAFAQHFIEQIVKENANAKQAQADLTWMSEIVMLIPPDQVEMAVEMLKGRGANNALNTLSYMLTLRQTILKELAHE